MRLATIVEAGRMRAALVRGDRLLPIAGPGDELESIRSIASGGFAAIEAIASWAEDQRDADWRRMRDVELGPAVPDPGAIYTIVNDVSSREAWLDGDQWLLGKSMPGFCPVGPSIVTADELSANDLALGCAINGEPIQDGRTSEMRFGVREIVSFLSRHLVLRPGDLIATGTPARLTTPPGPDRHLEAGDEVVCWIEGIGELTTHIA
jgi:hypothetical protein